MHTHIMAAVGALHAGVYAISAEYGGLDRDCASAFDVIPVEHMHQNSQMCSSGGGSGSRSSSSISSSSSSR